MSGIIRLLILVSILVLITSGMVSAGLFDWLLGKPPTQEEIEVISKEILAASEREVYQSTGIKL